MTVLKEVVKACPQVTVGAGTILFYRRNWMRCSPPVRRSVHQPRHYTVLAAAARDSALPYFPGVGSASDLMLAVEHGFKVVKLFPADLVGGVKMAKALWRCSRM
jgi:2-dehydro-3-deoxyphosphogluconate aldolase/(4S)-4-hydroxy-2-oxoglutarate aldolase